MDKTTRLYHATNDELTTRERFEKMLVDRGMFADQAESVMDKAIPVIDGQMNGYKTTWNRPASEYPDAVYNVLWPTIKPIALEYIQENLPNAWYKSMFV